MCIKKFNARNIMDKINQIFAFNDKALNESENRRLIPLNSVVK